MIQAFGLVRTHNTFKFGSEDVAQSEVGLPYYEGFVSHWLAERRPVLVIRCSRPRSRRSDAPRTGVTFSWCVMAIPSNMPRNNNNTSLPAGQRVPEELKPFERADEFEIKQFRTGKSWAFSRDRQQKTSEIAELCIVIVNRVIARPKAKL